MRRHLRQSILFLMRLTGLISILRFLHRHQIVILMMHGVMDEQEKPSWTPLWHRVSRKTLEEYLRVLSRRYRFVSLMDAVDMLQGRKPVQPYSMVLTFDDGYRNNITHALPILRRYHAPATFFVPTGFLDRPRPLWYDRLDYAVQHGPAKERELKIGSLSMHLDYSSREALHRSYIRFVRTAQKERMSDCDFLTEMDRLTCQLEAESGRRLSDTQKDDDWSAAMTWEQVEREAGDGVSFGSHTVDHIRLGLVGPRIAQDQLARSKQAIELHTGRPCQSISFPRGSFTDETIALAVKSGYTCGLTTIDGMNRVGDDVMRLRRLPLPKAASEADLLAYVSGASMWLSGLSQIHLRPIGGLFAKTCRIMAHVCGLVRTRGLRGAVKCVEADLRSEREFLVLRHNMDLSAAAEEALPPCDIYQIAGSQAEDLDALSRVWPRELGTWRRKGLRSELARDLENDNWCFVARLNGDMVGAVWLSKVDAMASHCGIPHDPHERVVRRLFVVSQARGRKISKQLLRHAAKVAKDRGVPQLVSLILPEREPSLRAHMSVGFIIAGGVTVKTRLGRSRYECTPPGELSGHRGIAKDLTSRSERMTATHRQ